MIKNIPYFTLLIWMAGLIHLIIAAANFFVPSKLQYQENLSKVSSMVRKVFWVHNLYIVWVLLVFAGLCFFFVGDLVSGNPLGRFLSGWISLFWTVRLGTQIFYYEAEVKKKYRFVNYFFIFCFIYLGILFGVIVFK